MSERMTVVPTRFAKIDVWADIIMCRANGCRPCSGEASRTSTPIDERRDQADCGLRLKAVATKDSRTRG